MSAITRPEPGDLAAAVARGMVEAMRQPENVAGFAGALLLPLLVSHGRRIPLVPFIVFAAIGDQAGRMAWRASRNLELLAEGRQLEYHGKDCPGHTTGPPGKSCLGDA